MKDLRYIVLWKCRTTSVSRLVSRVCNIPDSGSLVSNICKRRDIYSVLTARLFCNFRKSLQNSYFTAESWSDQKPGIRSAQKLSTGVGFGTGGFLQPVINQVCLGGLSPACTRG